MKIVVQIDHTELVVAPGSGSAWRRCLVCGADGFPDGTGVKTRIRVKILEHTADCPVGCAERLEQIAK